MTGRVRAPLKTANNKEDTTMPARTGYEHHPDFWRAYLATSVGLHIHGEQPEEELAKDYELFLDSPGCSPALRDALPGPLGRKKVKR